MAFCLGAASSISLWTSKSAPILYLDGTYAEDCVHRLLGHPDQLDEMKYLPGEVALASRRLLSKRNTPEGKAALADSGEWLLLFQFTLPPTIFTMDRFYFFIRKEDLTHRRFDRVWLTLDFCVV